MRKLLIASVWFVVLLSGCQASEQQTGEQPMTQSEIEQFAYLQFPASTREIQTYTEVGIDQLVILRFAMDAQDLQPFLQNSQFTTSLEEGYRPFPANYGAGLDWWDVEQVQRFAGARDRQDDVYRQIMVDLAEPEVTVIYMVVFET